MRIRRIAVLIDGGFFIKKLPGIVGRPYCETAEAVADWAQKLCKLHVQTLTGEILTTPDSRWLDHVYRLFTIMRRLTTGWRITPFQICRFNSGRLRKPNSGRRCFMSCG